MTRQVQETILELEIENAICDIGILWLRISSV